MLSRMELVSSTINKLLWIVCILVILAFAIWWWSTRDNRRALAEAKLGLAVLAGGITPENYESYGLKSYGEVRRLTLGRPVELSYVSDDELTEFGSEMTLQKLIKQSQTRMYPVLTDGEGRVLIRVSKYDKGWRFDSFGENDVARNLVRLEQRTSEKNDLGGVPQMAVDVLSMNLCFAAIGKSSSDESLRLVPLNDRKLLEYSGGFDTSDFLHKHPSFNAEPYGEANAREVFDALSLNAKEREGFVPQPTPSSPNITNEGKDRPSETRTAQLPQLETNRTKEPTSPNSPLAPPLPLSTERRKSKDSNPAESRRHEPSAFSKQPRLKSDSSRPQSAERHIVKRGECLARLAQMYYGRQIWQRIYSANRNILNNPDLIYPGQELAIPQMR
jgi:hypothetical protein